MRRLLFVAAIVFAVVALGVVVFAVVARSHRPDGPRITFRLQTDDGRTADANDAITAAHVLGRRMDGAGLAGIEIYPTADAEVVVYLPRALATNLDSIVKLAERAVTLEFRIVADATEDRKWRELKEAQDVKPPPELAWMPRKEGGPDMLVQTPERPLLAGLQRLKKRNVSADAAEYKAALATLEQTMREEVFTGTDIVRAEVGKAPGQHTVFFAFRDERKPLFAAFTERHVHEAVAIIIDGKVEAAPVIRSKLPGEGVIEGGAGGFTDGEAKDLAVVLGSGAIPGHLVRVSTPEPK